MRKNVMRSIVLAIAIFLAAGCGDTGEATMNVEVMDTVASFAVYGDEANGIASNCVQELNRIEHLLSPSVEGSDTARINMASGHWVSVSPTAMDITKSAMELYAITDGAYDPTVRTLTRLWGFGTPSQREPDINRIKSALAVTGAGGILIQDASVCLPEGASIDFSAIGHGYALDRVMDIMKQRPPDGAVVWIGTDALAWGVCTDGSLPVISLPAFRGDASLGSIVLDNRIACTSSVYQDYFECQRKIYHHILDPRTGYPADSGIVSATIVSAQGVLADGLSTAMIVLGEEDAVALWKNLSGFEMILVCDDGKVLYTEGIKFISDSLSSNTQYYRITR